MKSSYIVRATNFLHRIYPYISNVMNNPTRLHVVIDEYNCNYKRAIKVYNGATRCVLATSDYVIKWNYGKRYERFGGCENEVDMYKIACEEGYAYLFAEATATIYAGKFFEIMPRFELIEDKPELYELVNGKEYDWICAHVDDIHDNNYTVIEDYPIIIDYACRSFNSSSSSS